MSDYWNSIEKALHKISDTAPDTFDGVRDILHELADPEHPQPCTVNKRADHAFFAGSGGDYSLRDHLRFAGWRTAWSDAAYYYVMIHPTTGELLSYAEGDVQRGVRSPVAAAEFESQIADGGLSATRDERGGLLTIRNA